MRIDLRLNLISVVSRIQREDAVSLTGVAAATAAVLS